MSRSLLRPPGRAGVALLQACFGTGDTPPTAYARWRDLTDFEQLPPGALELLPLLAGQVTALALDDDVTGRIKGTRRRALWQGERALHHARAICRDLDGAGIETVVLGRAALVAGGLVTSAELPVGPVEILLSRKDVMLALDVITRAGWTTSRVVDEPVLSGSSQLLMEGADGCRLCLRWQCPDEIGIRRRAVRAPDPRRPWLLISAEDHLVQACLQSFDRDRAPMGWLADCALLLTRCPSWDWPVTVRVALEQGAGYQVADAMDVLTSVLELSVPDLPVLRSAHLPLRDRWLLRARQSQRRRIRVLAETLWFDRHSPEHPGVLAHAMVTHDAGSRRELVTRALGLRRPRVGLGGG